MNILYYSVHAILEDDEIRMLQGLGHTVMCLGINTRDGILQDFRAKIAFSPEEKALYDAFAQDCRDLGEARFSFSAAFLARIDVVVVMHEPAFIRGNWDQIRHKPVVWRTIGQGIGHLEALMRPYREDGLLIMRYSPAEARAPDYLGHDAVVRFYKDPARVEPWRGGTEQVLTFANLYEQRYSGDALHYRDIVAGLPAVLGGIGNEAFANAIGLAPPEEQRRLYRDSRVYLYASGLEIPYTLNFLEAWGAGIPVVVHCPLEWQGPYLEIPDLITHGVDGFVCRSIPATRYHVALLLQDRAMAARIGTEGARAAARLFGADGIRRQWADFLDEVVARRRSAPVR